MLPKSDFAKVVEKEKNRLGTEAWEKIKMAARNLSEKDLRQMREAAEVALHALNDLLGLNAQQTPDPAGNVQHFPRDPLAPTYPLDTGGAGEFVGPNGEIIIRLG